MDSYDYAGEWSSGKYRISRGLEIKGDRYFIAAEHLGESEGGRCPSHSAGIVHLPCL